MILLPCPFCGNKKLYNDELKSWTDDKVIAGWVGCEECGVHLEKENKQQAISAWNGRIKL